MDAGAPQVGAADPELETSPILDRDAADAVDAERESDACYFNNRRFPLGQYVRSGHDLLRCEERGVWIRKREDPWV
jgi:hypothetical protein